MPVHLSTPVPGGCVRGRVPFTHASSRYPPTFLGVPEPVGVQQGHGNVCPGEGAVGSVHGCGAPGWGVPVVVVCGRGDVVGYRWPGAAAGWYRDETSGLRGSATMCGVTGADHVLVPPFPC